jgi:hypothetical protein
MNNYTVDATEPCAKCSHGVPYHNVRLKGPYGVEYGCSRVDCGCMKYQDKATVVPPPPPKDEEEPPKKKCKGSCGKGCK